MISKNITLDEAIRSEAAVKLGVPNMPNAIQLQAMKLLAEKVFEPARTYMGAPIKISSFFRSKSVNAYIGGSNNSQHCLGEAIDLKCYDNLKLFNYIKDNLEFDQLINEFPNVVGQPAWVHVSYKAKDNRGEVLVAKKIGGKTVYQKWT
jgi:hypothetical protein